MTDELDCRGLACPEPVLKTKKAIDIEGTNEVLVVVDNQAAKENVCRFLESRGTCLNHFDLLNKKQVGESTNMLDIVTAMQLADKVVNI